MLRRSSPSRRPVPAANDAGVPVDPDQRAPLEGRLERVQPGFEVQRHQRTAGGGSTGASAGGMPLQRLVVLLDEGDHDVAEELGHLGGVAGLLTQHPLQLVLEL